MSKMTGSTNIGKRFFHELGRTPKRVAYIPSESDFDRQYFQKTQEQYKLLGVETILYCDVDKEFSISIVDAMFNAEVIQLSGGFTPYFLNNLRNRGLIKPLAEYGSEQGCLIGVSAGALIMGKDLAILLEDQEEGNATRELENIGGLGLYDFEFYPHFGRSDSDFEKLQTRSSLMKNTIIACNDQSGIILGENSNLIAINEVQVFKSGIHQIFEDSPFSL
ncbi:MAG TPA: Type 1 glutamine amidotransferase-like domain-containing protein [Bacteriovoracaceae bacterium]|nr:Type 1 glutamine amidotransferase-like domain-containing protein [Bacteriovoracaceae bacterium]